MSKRSVVAFFAAAMFIISLWGCGSPASGSSSSSKSTSSQAASVETSSQAGSSSTESTGGIVMTDNIKVFGQNSILITAGNKKIYIDPFQMKETPKDADYILITHEHSDHYSPEDMKKVAGTNTLLVMPESMKSKEKEASGIVSRIEYVKPSENRTIEGLQLETVPAYNINKQFHPKSNGWVGYVLTVDGKRIYIAGDMDATDEAKAVKCDIALVPVGGTYTMTAAEAAELINVMKPQIAIPVHYGSVVGSSADADTFAKTVKEPVKTEIKIGR